MEPLRSASVRADTPAEGVTGRMRQAQFRRIRVVARARQVLDYAFYLLYGLLALEIVLELLGAHDSAGFKRFVDGATGPFLSPFRNLVTDPTVLGGRLRLSYIIGLIAYVLLHRALIGLLRLVVERRNTV